jgi:hypothetical protein
MPMGSFRTGTITDTVGARRSTPLSARAVASLKDSEESALAAAGAEKGSMDTVRLPGRALTGEASSRESRTEDPRIQL